jgi:large subunit ribosomal protein L23
MSILNKKIIISPRITEKASEGAHDKNIYAFNVTKDANKKGMMEAIKALYKVEALDVRFVPVVRKRVFSKGKWGMTAGGKKAYVQLKKGDKIEFV